VGWKKEGDRRVDVKNKNIGEKRKNNLPLTIQSTFIIPMPSGFLKQEVINR
jgi:hypothetical protein